MKFLKSIFGSDARVPKVDLDRRFEVIGQIGQGSMSRVWRVRDLGTGKIAALKVLDGEKTRRFEARFVGLEKPTEGEAAVQLQHPHIVHTYETGISTDNLQFLAMELIQGVGLNYLVDVQNEKMQEDRLRFILELGDAIHYFHQAEWIHRDICPRNVLLNQDYQVKLIDFGLVVPNTPPFRKPGNRTGTVSYMAPELIKRQSTDQRIDIFSFAATCYEMFAKRLPWDHSGVSLEMVLQHINQPPIDIRTFVPDIDEQIADAIMIGLSTHPDDRWSSISEMISEIRQARKRLEGVEDASLKYLDRVQSAPDSDSRKLDGDFFNQPGVHSVSAMASSTEFDDDEDVSATVQGGAASRIKQSAEDEDGYIDLDSYFEVDDDDDDDYEEV